MYCDDVIRKKWRNERRHFNSIHWVEMLRLLDVGSKGYAVISTRKTKSDGRNRWKTFYVYRRCYKAYRRTPRTQPDFQKIVQRPWPGLKNKVSCCRSRLWNYSFSEFLIALTSHDWPHLNSTDSEMSRKRKLGTDALVVQLKWVVRLFTPHARLAYDSFTSQLNSWVEFFDVKAGLEARPLHA